VTAPKDFFKEYRIFGNYVREARKAMGLSQSQLGKLVDLSEGSVRSLELGRQGVYLRTAIQMANALGFSLSSIQTDVAEGQAASEIKEKMLAMKREDLDKQIKKVTELNKQYELLKSID
jgi:transcriptional regulator with XRE-family HTH domain